jgi:hypothetical protein
MDLSAHKFKEVYQWLGINLNTLGCLMLDVEPIKIEYFEMYQDGVNAYFPGYKSKNKERFWIDGYVGDKAHVTLLYGFLAKAKEYQPHIEKVLTGWELKTVTIADISFFESPYEDEKYYCVVAKIDVTDELLEGRGRLEFLPHVNTFTRYTPHITIGYIIDDVAIRDRFINYLKMHLVGKQLKVCGLNFGG